MCITGDANLLISRILSMFGLCLTYFTWPAQLLPHSLTPHYKTSSQPLHYHTLNNSTIMKIHYIALLLVAIGTLALAAINFEEYGSTPGEN